MKVKGLFISHGSISFCCCFMFNNSYYKPQLEFKVYIDKDKGQGMWNVLKVSSNAICYNCNGKNIWSVEIW